MADFIRKILENNYRFSSTIKARRIRESYHTTEYCKCLSEKSMLHKVQYTIHDLIKFTTFALR